MYSEAFGPPHTTIRDRVKGLHGTHMGQPTVLSEEEEKWLAEMVQLLADWGFPFTGDDLRYFVKSYLDKKGLNLLNFDQFFF